MAGAAEDAHGLEFLLELVDRFPFREEFTDSLEQPNPDTLGFLRPSMATGLHRRRCRCHRPVAVDPDTTAALYISVSPGLLSALVPSTGQLLGGVVFLLYWLAVSRSPALTSNKSMAPWFCTRSLVRHPPPDTTGSILFLVSTTKRPLLTALNKNHTSGSSNITCLREGSTNKEQTK
ncbi:uncharacterized protein LOC119331128 [Triticum dicoccoides]|uniref:uncharacterized protein LOC119331128 n=1 Tax=Triticum dicoccoides TaxID=85692 RepID=UPI0018918820|nr:uncharacterized protein LOC119331128 [Triticum dicoccoides]